MTIFGFLLDLIKYAIATGGEDVILPRGKDPVARVILAEETTLPTRSPG